MEFERGSEWRRWDLHLHTASSYDYSYKDDDCDELLAKKLKEHNIAAVAITDHFVIDKNRIRKLRTIAPEIVFFPGVELRTDKGDTNIHIILIFSDQIDIDELVEDFNVFKRSAQNHDDNAKIYWDYNQIVKFAQDHDALISVHAGRKSNGVDDRISNVLPHNQAVKEEYASTISIFEMGQPKDLDEYKKFVFPDIGIKPMIICSDNHDARNYNPINKLWIKADVTFNGLKQIIYEPEERVMISESKPDYKPDYYVIDSIEFKDDDFQSTPIKFSKNLTCVIGGKSTGKSILLHNLAMTIDKVQVETTEATSETSTKNVSEAIVVWADGKNNEERKIIYIPQTYLNRLSDERESTTPIDEIIQDVVLIDDEMKDAHEKMLKYTKDNKSITNQTILELLEIYEEINSSKNSRKELGTKEGIINQIKALKEQKDELSKSSELSAEELKSFEIATRKIKDLKQQIEEHKDEIEHIKSIKSVVELRKLDYSYSDCASNLMKRSMDETIKAANIFWKSEKEGIIDNINSLISEKEKIMQENKEVFDSLKDKVNENKAVSEISNKIHIETDKLEEYNKIENQECELVRKEKELIDKLCNSSIAFKRIHNDYAKAINNNSSLASNDLEFLVDVPLRKDAFIDKVSEILNNRISFYRDLIKPDDFQEDVYTPEWLNRITINLLNGKLQTKNGYTKETALREIFDNWYGIKYVIKMDNDTIDVMSPGKKALVLLKLLIDLAESKCPILIDQPEDDLDNRSIFEDLIPFIKKKKKDRQIIIVTHNANVVLGADAEEVIVANQQGNNVPNKKYRFEYRSGSIENNNPVYNSQGDIEEGILNKQGIQQHICDILEGGEKAFELRKNKYHI